MAEPTGAEPTGAEPTSAEPHTPGPDAAITTEAVDVGVHQIRRSHSAVELPNLDTDRPAGIVSRGLGAILDVIVVLVVLGCFYVGFVIARLIHEVQNFSLPATNPFFTATAFIVASLIYLTTCWAVSGRTVGSVVMGLRLVSRKGRPQVRLTVAFIRALICVFFAVGLLWVVVDPRRRSVADLIVRTRVMYSR